jgi:hypothetical protein
MFGDIEHRLVAFGQQLQRGAPKARRLAKQQIPGCLERARRSLNAMVGNP